MRLVSIDAKKMRFFGMMKSGNHAVISWLHKNMNGGRYVFLNNCKAWEDPFASFCQVEIDGKEFRRSRLRGIELEGLLEQHPIARRDFTVSYENKIPRKQSHLSGFSDGLKRDFFCHQVEVILRYSNWMHSIVYVECVLSPSYRSILLVKLGSS